MLCVYGTFNRFAGTASFDGQTNHPPTTSAPRQPTGQPLGGQPGDVLTLRTVVLVGCTERVVGGAGGVIRMEASARDRVAKVEER